MTSQDKTSFLNMESSHIKSNNIIKLESVYDYPTQSMEEILNDNNSFEILANPENATTSDVSNNTNLTSEDINIINNTFTDELLVWLSQDYTINDHLEFMVKTNFKKFMEYCMMELDYKWKKENLLDKIVIPNSITFVHNKLKKPNTNSQKRNYYVKRRKILEDLFSELGYEEFKQEIIKKVYANDPWTSKNGGGPPKSWWADVARWIRLDYFKIQTNTLIG
ncbi:unnamed protein product [Cunninghamella echinulata]